MSTSTTARSRYGGLKNLKGTRTGFFHTEVLNGRHWFIDPDGCAFFAVGTCRFQFPEESRRDRISWFKPARRDAILTKEIWYRHTFDRLASWGFNWGAPWTDVDDHGAVYTGWIDASYGFGLESGKLEAPGIPHYMTFVDIFDPAFARRFAKKCKAVAAQRKNDCLPGISPTTSFSGDGDGTRITRCSMPFSTRQNRHLPNANLSAFSETGTGPI